MRGLCGVQHPGFGCADPSDERIRALIPGSRALNPYVPWHNWPQCWMLDNMANDVNGVARNQVRKRVFLPLPGADARVHRARPPVVF